MEHMLLKLNTQKKSGREMVDVPIVINILQLESFVPLDQGGTSITMQSGNRIVVSQSLDEIIDQVPVGDLYIEPLSEPEAPTDEDLEEISEILTEEDVAAIASAAAIELAAEAKISLVNVPPNSQGRIGKPEVQAYLKSLENEGDEDEDTPDEDTE